MNQAVDEERMQAKFIHADMLKRANMFTHSGRYRAIRLVTGTVSQDLFIVVSAVQSIQALRRLE